MKRTITIAVCLGILAAVSQAQVPGFINYQGRLLDGTNLYSGTVDIAFMIYTNESGGALYKYIEIDNNVEVVDGLYSTVIGDNAAGGSVEDLLTYPQIYLEVEIDGTTLTPRERIASSFFAFMAESLENNALKNQMIQDNAVTGDKIADGSISNADIAVDALAGQNIADGTISNADIAASAIDSSNISDGTIVAGDVDVSTFSNTFWKVDGNAGTTAGTDYIGTSDDQALDIRVNATRALRIEPAPGSPNLIAGSDGNSVFNFVYGATVAGGGNATEPNTIKDNAYYAFIGGGKGNEIGGTIVMPEGSVIGGGFSNFAISACTFIGGGNQNYARGQRSMIGGGFGNKTYANYSVIAGGQQNIVTNNTGAIGGGAYNETRGDRATIAGGQYNDAYGAVSFVGGGDNNRATGAGTVIGGGDDNVATGMLSAVAGGSGNYALGDSSFVGGGAVNTVQGNYSMIGGGQLHEIRSASSNSVIGGGRMNVIETGPAVIGGGYNNRIYQGSLAAVIGGGQNNVVDTNGEFGVISGGQNNLIELFAYHSYIGGGYANRIRRNGYLSTIVGGVNNTIQTNAFAAFIGGGGVNTVGVDAAYATIPGGHANAVNGRYGFAAGRRAIAEHEGSFVWNDSDDEDFSSTTNDQFAISASNGVWVAEDAGENKDVPYGTRFGDNTIVAWAKVFHSGLLQDSFNVLSATNTAEGVYQIVLRTPASSNTELIPVASVETDTQPASLNDVRFISIDQYQTNYFNVYINNGNGVPTNHEFTVIVTGR